ncbi:hypothetical protein [Neobacillus cucumis]|uniref:Lycopene cyclase domain-containing protein n=1 Tax=Neobacillus cucumis TaxID=1740721 RepID=A0A2N5HNW3_9BACI|nr:hypothetical protein [Neobacillus cucumis]PLS07216.1 hypothetical protein CVD27_05930 [Neobacillus cucumis]
MKPILIVLVLAGGLLSLIIFLDFIMGTAPIRLVWKALNPFRVMEPAEYVIVFLFTLLFCLRLLKSFLKKRQQGDSQTN